MQYCPIIDVTTLTQQSTFRLTFVWPSKESVQAFMNDPEYAPHLKARTEGSISNHFLVEATDDFA